MVSELSGKGAGLVDTVRALLDESCPILVDAHCVGLLVEKVRPPSTPASVPVISFIPRPVATLCGRVSVPYEKSFMCDGNRLYVLLLSRLFIAFECT